MKRSKKKENPLVTDGRPDLFDDVLNGRLEIKKLRINTNLVWSRPVRLFPPAMIARGRVSFTHTAAAVNFSKERAFMNLFMDPFMVVH